MMFGRTTTRKKKKQAQEFIFPAPVRGLVRSGTVIGADPRACEVLENYIPTAEGARIRGGSVKLATLDGPVLQLMRYRSGATETLFAATETDIFDVTNPSDPDVTPTAAISSLTSGDWSFTQFATPGGQFLMAVNGADDARLYNGTSWLALDGSSTPAFTGVDTDDLSFVWAHKRRLWFVEKNTLSAWYLPVNSIAGAATEFPLDGIFRLGGALLFGGTWSQDSGDGLDDYAVFVTTEGEIAVYQGTDPSTAADWSLVGVYVIGKPLNKNAWFRGGGDFVILTEDGIVPISEALMKDRAALQAEAITSPIEDLWQAAIANRGVEFNFSVSLWSTQTALFIGTPDLGGGTRVLVANTRTGAWATITGWDIQCSIVFRDGLYFGTKEGLVVQADVQGADQGLPYTARYVPKFQEFGSADCKVACRARILARSAEKSAPRVVVFSDYTIGQYPPEFDAPAPVGAIWGTAVWGEFIWGGSVALTSQFEWQAVSGQGFSLAPAIVTGSNSGVKPSFELIGCVLRYERGRSL
jgi:hypothetical protein